jgi:hypothetical protein
LAIRVITIIHRLEQTGNLGSETMLTTIVVVLVLVAVIAVAAWWFFDFDMPEVAIPAAVPGVGAGILYWYWGPLAWATVPCWR